MKLKDYRIGDVTVTARSFRTAQRRVRGFERGEFDIDGKTILAKDRTPPGKPMRKKKRKGN